ncbi:MAG: hypothetical protein EB009_05150 [Actinobacteria bacterium]|nr:hypothetical protein [Actinomycetota bacterium]NCZ72664.1 hypothetical protein [Actinomycetota bacterium]NDA58308.1 hypothetical protein [Actinomycetota bacterium]NDB37474.1 hypothetical protein [Actinomycetota bacterium]NDD52067.1 hypothetical protein [Actinomycetota bacterium]
MALVRIRKVMKRAGLIGLAPYFTFMGVFLGLPLVAFTGFSLLNAEEVLTLNNFLTVFLTLLLLIPTIAYRHLVIPGARAWVEFLTLSPLVIPPMVQGVGFLYSMPKLLKATPNASISKALVSE